VKRGQLVPDYPLVLLALALSTFGVAMVFSAGQTDVPTFVSGLWRSQLMWLALGLCAAYFASRASVRLLDWMTTPVYALSCFILLILVFVGKGAGTAASTKSWLAIGGVRLGQPSEIAKIAVVLMLAKVLASRREAPKSLLDLWQPALVVGIPWLLIMLQPDLGTGIVFIGIFFAMLFWSGVSWQLLVLCASPGVSLVLAFSTGVWGAWFLLLLALVLWYRPYIAEGVFVVVMNVVMGVVAPTLWEKLSPYQQNRLLVFLDPTRDPQRSGYHVIQSQVAIGRMVGQGLYARHTKAARLSAGAAYRFHFPGRRRRARFSRRDARARALHVSLFAVRARRRAGDGFVLESGRVRLGVDLVRACHRECRDDAKSDADYRDPVAVFQLWGIVYAGVLDCGWDTSSAVLRRSGAG
jgi:cell division protein FtsW (lipid II flippase)